MRHELWAVRQTVLSAGLRQLLPTGLLPIEVLPEEIALPSQPLQGPFSLPALLPAGLLRHLRWLQCRRRFGRRGWCSRHADSGSRSALAQRRAFDSLSEASGRRSGPKRRRES